ncbi:hypothetical protein KCU65_g72, partial [Aureobasidium melanogenum]
LPCFGDFLPLKFTSLRHLLKAQSAFLHGRLQSDCLVKVKELFSEQGRPHGKPQASGFGTLTPEAQLDSQPHKSVLPASRATSCQTNMDILYKHKYGQQDNRFLKDLLRVIGPTKSR